MFRLEIQGTLLLTDSLDSSAGIGLQLQTPYEWISSATACTQFSPTNQSCWGSTDWSGRSNSQIGQQGVIQPEILCFWVWSVVWPLVAHLQELRYHAKQKWILCPLPLMPTLLSQQHLNLSPSGGLAWTVKRATVYTRGMKGRHISALIMVSKC